MLWLLFALAGALFDSLYSATGKKLLKNTNIFLVGSGAMFSSYHVKDLLGEKKQTAPTMTAPRVNLADYNILLKEAAS